MLSALKHSLLACLALACMGAGWLRAEEQQDKKPQKPVPETVHVVVTASKIERPSDQVTQKVDVIELDQIEEIPLANRNLAELIKYRGGLFVNVLSRNDANWGSYGGLGPKYNGLLLDGQPVDSFVDGMSLDPWALERVEVHQGPASVLYSNYLSMDFAGNQAPLAGVTNLVLKEEIDTRETRMLLRGGSFRTLDGRFYHQGKTSNVNYFVGAGHERSDYTDYGTPGSWLNILEDPAYGKTKLYGKATWVLGEEGHKLSLFAHHTKHSGKVGRPNRDYDHEYDTVNLGYSRQLLKRVGLQLKGGARWYDRRWGEDQYPTSLALRSRDGVKQRIVPFDSTLSFRHSENGVLSAGFDAQHATYETYSELDGFAKTGNQASASSLGLFAQEEFVLKNTVLRAGMRAARLGQEYDLISGEAPGLANRSWSQALWSAGARTKVHPRLMLYSNLGSSFVAPSPKSVGGTLNASDEGIPGRHGQLPNPALQPERGLAWDFGLDHLLVTEKGRVGIRGYLNRLEDAIVENIVSANPSQTRSVNAGKATSRGVHADLDYRLLVLVDLFANLTWTDTSIDNPLDPDQDGSDISFVPDYVANLGLTFRLPAELSLAPYVQAVGNYYDSTSRAGRTAFGPYQTVNVHVRKTMFRNPEYSADLVFDFNNIAHNRYEMPWQFRDPGFHALGGIELRLR